MLKNFKMEATLIADQLQFPEGPIFMDDGSIILVEIARGSLTKVTNDGKKEIIAHLGGGPNGAAVGPDGFCYVCNNGGFKWQVSDDKKYRRPVLQSEDYETGRIEKVNLETGCFETLYAECDGIPLKGPNDIVFDKHGNFWFTDLGKVRGRTMDRGSVYWAKADGSTIIEVIHPIMTPNGIGLSPDGKFLYVAETEGGKLYSFEIIENGVVKKIQFPQSVNGGHLLNKEGGIKRFDSLAVEKNGYVCVGTLITGGISVISPIDGLIEFHALDDPYITNICFGGENQKEAFITASYGGQLLKADWEREGLKLNF